jgi:23S rRNA pseudouridine1911/1915/1917 synthase
MQILEKKFTDKSYSIIYLVEDAENGMRLDQFAQIHFTTLSREYVKKRITCGDITISGRPHPHRPSTKVYKGEKIQILTTKSNHEDEYWRGEIVPEETPMIVDDHTDYVVISKPAFMATHPTGKHLFYTATSIMSYQLNSPMKSVHRIDRETSGVLLLGKNEKAAQVLTDLFENRKVKKAYVFIAHKKSTATTFPFVAEERLGLIDDHVPRNMVHCFPKDAKQGKRARTKFELVHDFGTFVLALAFPFTGRQHQIRAHAAFHGYPLLGDKMYNGDPTVFMRFKDGVPSESDFALMQIPRQALHAAALSLRIEYLQQTKLWVQPIPADLKKWLISQSVTTDEIIQFERNIKDLITKTFEIL